MIKWTEDLLKEKGYEIQNARITDVDLSMADHGCLTLKLVLNGGGWGCVYGGYVLGHGYVGADDDFFEGTAKGMESIMRIMDVVGSDDFNDMRNRIIRVATKGWGCSVKIIGNVLSDHWFDIESFFKENKE